VKLKRVINLIFKYCNKNKKRLITLCDRKKCFIYFRGLLLNETYDQTNQKKAALTLYTLEEKERTAINNSIQYYEKFIS
jgi:hypothetical protein